MSSRSSSSTASSATDARVAATDLATAISAHGSNVGTAEDVAIGHAGWNNETTILTQSLAPEVADALAGAAVALGGGAFETSERQLEIAAELLGEGQAAGVELARELAAMGVGLGEEGFRLAGEAQAAQLATLDRVLGIAESADKKLSSEIFKWGAVIALAALAAWRAPDLARAFK